MTEPSSWVNQPVSSWSKFVWDYKYRQNLVTLIMQYSMGGAVLDIGCLQGQYIQKLRSVGFKGVYKGVDISPDFIEVCKKYNPAEQFEVGDVHEIKEKNETWDMVVCSHVLDHLYYLERPLWEIFRVSKRIVVLSIMYATHDTEVHHDHDFINHFYSLADIFGTIPGGWKPIKSNTFHPEWDAKVNILQCVWKKV